MSKEGYISQNQSFIKNLPVWADELATKYGSNTASLYILHGNIRDLLPHKKKKMNLPLQGYRIIFPRFYSATGI